ncbi:MAG: NADP-dependent malic enzyme, partial [Hyphomicrobiaceae bacterium]
GRPILIGRGAPIREAFNLAGIGLTDVIEMHDTSLDERRQEYAEFLYGRLQRKGYLLRDCQRLVNNDRNVFAACMVAMGHADGMVTGVTRNWYTAYEDVRKVLDARPRRRVIGVSVALIRGRVVLVADVSVHDMPDGNQLADITEEAVRVARRLAIEPRVALLAYSTFGHPRGERSDRVREAVGILDKRQVDFEYDGDMAADVALNREALKQYPFCRLSDTANVLVMPAFHSASISTKMLKELGGATLIGPVLVGLTHSVQICPLNAKDSDVVNMAALAAYDVNC